MHKFVIRRNCPAKYIGDNRYLTDWEKKMKLAIDRRIDEELALKREKKKAAEAENKRPLVVVLELPEEVQEQKYREEKSALYEKNYRRNWTLKILEKYGLDIAEFKKTWMGSCDRSDMLLGCVQDVIDGFEYEYDGLRTPYYHGPMNRNKMEVGYEGDVLTVSDDHKVNEFWVDEHQLIFLNGEQLFKGIVLPIPTKEEDEQTILDLIDDIAHDRLEHEKRMRRSLEYAKTWRVEE